ncbi:MAG: DUF397 domain-containing protein [Pseudonocardiaceae bacterium]
MPSIKVRRWLRPPSGVSTLGSATTVRDSKDPRGSALTFTPTQWAAFTAGIRAGEFHPLG